MFPPTAAAAAVVSAATAATTAGSALFTGPGDIDCQGAASQLFAIQSIDRLLSLLGCTHRHKGKPTRAAGGPVEHQVGLEDRAVRREGVLQVVFGDVETEVSNEQSCTHLCLSVRN